MSSTWISLSQFIPGLQLNDEGKSQKHRERTNLRRSAVPEPASVTPQDQIAENLAVQPMEEVAWITLDRLIRVLYAVLRRRIRDFILPRGPKFDVIPPTNHHMEESNGGSDQETDRVTVKTYVPRYQKEEWQARAADLEMSQSEFVRTMVQAGKRDFDIPDEGGSRDVTPGGEGLEEQVLGVLGASGPLEWEDLVAELIGDFETQLEETLKKLQNENRVQYSGRQGYTLTDE